MSLEGQPVYRQEKLSGFSINDGKISESVWTKFAIDHGLTISIKPIIHRRHLKALGGKPTFHGDLSVFVGSPWRNFLNNKSIFELAIHNYKQLNNQARPSWSKSFTERSELGRNSEGKKYISLDYDKSEGGKFYSVEKEEFKVDGAVITVVRYTNSAGSSRRVLVILPGSLPGTLKVRQEDWVSKGRWVVTSNSEMAKENAEELIPF